MATYELKTSNKRDTFIDSLKGIAIILVVIGHVAVAMFGEDQAENNIIFRICYSFHMPLFMTISGFLTGGGKNIHDFIWLKRRAQRLLLPYIIWSIVFCTIRFDGLYGYVYNVFVEPAIWFLPCLFLCNTYLVFLNYIKSQKVVKAIIIYFIVSIIGIILNIRIMKDFTIFLPFYMLGYVYKNNITDVLNDKHKCIILSCCTVLYPISMFVYTFGTNEASERANIMAERFEFGNQLIFKAGFWFNSRFIIACLGMGMCIAIFKILYKYCVVVLKPFAFIGEHTMAIYILSGYFYFDVLNKISNSFIVFVLGTLICTSIPLAISVVIKNYIPKVYKVLFG